MEAYHGVHLSYVAIPIKLIIPPDQPSSLDAYVILTRTTYY